ncbi:MULTISPECIES: hypothetical protein [Staphylococcus]|uniref:hypothetical protein n=1 Tax=Staphylococcus TaxID=1279 RepID=UPI000D1F3DDD|nr:MULTISPECIES: hypothetical protein [Staphylococcus]MCE5037422.1 hypothetical protein [Staphylococcus haemolyticus]PTK52546.1 hypothetical protein BUZ37_11885 [Staphylococcus haemolyticus]
MLKILGYKQGTKIKNDSKFPLCSYKEFEANSKFGVFLKETAPAGTKKVDEFLSHFMSIFNLHITGQCLKNVTGFAQIFVCEIKIYLFGSYLCFKSVYKFLI